MMRKRGGWRWEKSALDENRTDAVVVNGMVFKGHGDTAWTAQVRTQHLDYFEAAVIYYHIC